KTNMDSPRSIHSYGITALARGLLKFERWDEIADGKTIPWRDIFSDKVNKAYFEARAYLAKGELQKAEKSITEHASLKKDVDKNKNGITEGIYPIQAVELRARLQLARGETLDGLATFAGAAQNEFDYQKRYADPP